MEESSETRRAPFLKQEPSDDTSLSIQNDPNGSLEKGNRGGNDSSSVYREVEQPESTEKKTAAGLESVAEGSNRTTMATDQQLHALFAGIVDDDNLDLQKSLEEFMARTNSSIGDIFKFLDRNPNIAEKAHSRPDFNDELRLCLQKFVESTSGRDTFNEWTENKLTHSPKDSPAAETKRRSNPFFGEDFSPNKALARAQVRIREEQESAARKEIEEMKQRPQPSRLATSIFASMYYDTSLLNLNEQHDAAEEEAAGRFSTEDRDFVTPWYTYVIRVIMPPLGLLIFYFIYWRCYYYPNSGIWWSDALAWTFIACEATCYLFAMTHWVWIWNLKFRKRVTAQELNLRDQDLPTIDIMIPCYSEPTEIVEMTLKACYDMDYPDDKITVWVCDDGGKEDMKKMVLHNGALHKGRVTTRYIARVKIKGVPHHAKAGNLNNCILNEGSKGQLIIILDCDMLPEPCMARVVAPFFYKKLPLRDGKYERFGPPDETDFVNGRPVQRAEFDNGTGLLQTPQAFYNLDSDDLLGQSYAFFYECQLSGWDGCGCTPCCGTGVTFNRYALEKVGGFSIGSITEDFKTSLNLCANGFKCKYFLQRMTRGVSPKELNAFMIQRQRWAVGAIQIVLAGNPLFVKGLHFRARWLYFFSTVGMVYIIPVVVMGLIMYTTILVGVNISFGPTSFEQYLLIGGSASVVMMIMQYLAGWRLSRRDYLRALQDNFTVFWTLIRSILIGFFGLELGFAVTNKDVSFDLWLNIMHATPHLMVYLVSGSAMVKGGLEMLAYYDVISIPWSTDYNVSLLWYSMFWTAFIWLMVSSPPRMVLYGYFRSRREAKSKVEITNANVPAFQELPSTPMHTFPPLSPEIWKKGTKSSESNTFAEV